jgi:aspartyl-tRNA(Asn)/glutamyl-tRNA(Gln) amidotransferase subunit A
LFSFTTIRDYHQKLLNGQTTCVEAVLHYIEQIKQKQHLSAWLEIFEEEAIARAKALDAVPKDGSLTGKLHGVVVGLKDVICYKDHKVSAASKILKNFTSLFNATATQRLLDEGAIIIGRQNCDEFAMGSSNENSAYGPVKNAIDETRVPGGSSGGSAVAVQAGMCMVSLGSDTGGSVRQPADFCGIVGLKPTYGRVSRHGLIAYASSFDQIGILGKSVDDVSLTFEIISGEDEFDSTVSSKPVPNLSTCENSSTPLKIAYFSNSLDHPSLDREISTTIKSFLQTLTEAGHTVQPIEFEYLDYIVPTYYVLTTAEASSNLSRYDGVKYGYQNGITDELVNFYKKNRSEAFGDEVKKRILLGTFVLSSGYYDAYFTKAQQVRQLLIEETLKIFKDFDAIILPTVPTPAFKIGEKNKDSIAMFLADIYTVFANLTGIPAISLPLFQHSTGLPFGLQVMTSQFNELLLHQISNNLMDALGKEIRNPAL